MPKLTFPKLWQGKVMAAAVVEAEVGGLTKLWLGPLWLLLVNHTSCTGSPTVGMGNRVAAMDR